jgi:hypothetical protein
VVQRDDPITSADLATRPNATLDAFMRRVYDLQVEIWRSQGATFTPGLPSGQLDPLPTRDALPGRPIELHKDVVGQVRAMLSHARGDLARDRAAGVPEARKVTDVRVRSGYRSAQSQLGIWQHEWPKYYRDTRSHRRSLPGGEHGDDAAQYLAGYINQRVFSPGYSPHQGGQTVDLTFEEKGTWAEADTSPAAIAAWRASWLFGWLQRNAAGYGFVQNPNLNEPWHWEFNNLLFLIQRLIEWAIGTLDRILSVVRDFLGLERDRQREPAQSQ